MTTPANAPTTTQSTNRSSASAFRTATIVGTVLQLAMVISGHWIQFIKLNVFAIGGMLISALAGVVYARSAHTDRRTSAIQGALVGGLSALIGIVVSFALGDVTASILVIGTVSSAIAGAIGGGLAPVTR